MLEKPVTCNMCVVFTAKEGLRLLAIMAHSDRNHFQVFPFLAFLPHSKKKPSVFDTSAVFIQAAVLMK